MWHSQVSFIILFRSPMFIFFHLITILVNGVYELFLTRSGNFHDTRAQSVLANGAHLIDSEILDQAVSSRSQRISLHQSPEHGIVNTQT